MNSFKVKDFKPKWKYLKSNLLESDVEFFENVVDIEGSVGRVITFSEKPYNPRYIQFWFPVCRCHWGVLFPCWLLNGRSFKGNFKIITNNRHSAIINVRTNEIYDPTYSANGIDLKTTLDQFHGDYEIVPMLIHAAKVDTGVLQRLFKICEEEEKNV